METFDSAKPVTRRLNQSTFCFSPSQRLLTANDYKSVFDQSHFQGAMNRIVSAGNGKPDKKGYPTAIIEDFYIPVFSTRRIKKGLVLPGWEESFGARWEYQILQNLKIPIGHFPTEWLLETC